MKDTNPGGAMTRDTLIRAPKPGFPAKYCTGTGHYLLQADGSWSVCDQYTTVTHSHCVPVTIMMTDGKRAKMV